MLLILLQLEYVTKPFRAIVPCQCPSSKSARFLPLRGKNTFVLCYLKVMAEYLADFDNVDEALVEISPSARLGDGKTGSRLKKVIL